MPRPIDGDAVKRKVWDIAEEWKDRGGDYEALLLESVVEQIVDTQPILTPPNDWVSVEEGLPERGKDVLLYFEEESRVSVGGRYDVGDGWYAVIVNEYETICDTSPRYWMPLPAPPDRRPPEGEEDT